MLRKLAILFVVLSVSLFAQENGQKVLGVSINGVLSGPAIGMRGWVTNLGYSLNVGTDWDFTEFNSSASVMYGFPLNSNKYYVVGRIGYLGFSDNQTDYSFSGKLLTVGLGIGYEWFVNHRVALSIDGGYNFVGTLNYEVSVGPITMEQSHEVPLWVGGNFTYYF